MKALALGFLLVLTGCVTSSGMKEEVRKRATFDLDCPAERVQIVEIESPTNVYQGKQGTWGARGCGRQATYVQLNGSSNIMMNSAAREQ